MTENTALDVYNDDDVTSAIEGLKSGNTPIFSTLAIKSEADADTLLDALTNAEPISDHLGETINLRNFIVERRKSIDEKSGEVQAYAAVTLIDEDGSSYVANSMPVLKELERIVTLRGEPSTWATPKAIVVVKEGKSPREYFALKAAPRKK